MGNTFDVEITLISEIEVGKDDMGNPILETKEDSILASLKSITHTEFYKAGQLGYDPKYQFNINFFEYNNETKLKYENKIYKIIRTYRKDDILELIAAEKVGVK